MASDNRTWHLGAVRTVGVPVRDQDRALDFYTRTLGMDVRLETSAGPQRWIEVAPPGSPTTVALVATPAGQPVGIDSQIRLTTDDAVAAHADLAGQGVDVDPEVLAYPVPMFRFRDLDGNQLYLVQVPPIAER